MILGVIAPIFMLVLFEVYFIFNQKQNPDFIRYQKIKSELPPETETIEESSSQNRHGRKVIAMGVLGTGILIVSIGIFTVTGKWLVIGAGALIIAVSFIIKPKKEKVDLSS